MNQEYKCICPDCQMASPRNQEDCLEYLWCDKVGGKLYAFGVCGDAFQEILVNCKKSSGKRDRNFRRAMSQKEKQCRMRIIEHEIGGYNPAPGWIVKTSNGKYIRYPRDSDNQRFLKKKANRRFRRVKEDIPDGNFYRKLFDYWWELY